MRGWHGLPGQAGPRGRPALRRDRTPDCRACPRGAQGLVASLHVAGLAPVLMRNDCWAPAVHRERCSEGVKGLGFVQGRDRLIHRRLENNGRSSEKDALCMGRLRGVGPGSQPGLGVPEGLLEEVS